MWFVFCWDTFISEGEGLVYACDFDLPFQLDSVVWGLLECKKGEVSYPETGAAAGIHTIFGARSGREIRLGFES